MYLGGLNGRLNSLSVREKIVKLDFTVLNNFGGLIACWCNCFVMNPNGSSPFSSKESVGIMEKVVYGYI